MPHSKLSKVCRAPAAINSKLLSYSLPQTSQVPIAHLLLHGVNEKYTNSSQPAGALDVSSLSAVVQTAVRITVGEALYGVASASAFAIQSICFCALPGSGC